MVLPVKQLALLVDSFASVYILRQKYSTKLTQPQGYSYCTAWILAKHQFSCLTETGLVRCHILGLLVNWPEESVVLVLL